MTSLKLLLTFYLSEAKKLILMGVRVKVYIVHKLDLNPEYQILSHLEFHMLKREAITPPWKKNQMKYFRFLFIVFANVAYFQLPWFNDRLNETKLNRLRASKTYLAVVVSFETFDHSRMPIQLLVRDHSVSTFRIVPSPRL